MRISDWSSDVCSSDLIYTAVNAEAAQSALTAFEHGPWNQKFPTVAAAWRRAWEQVIPFFAFPPEVRRVIYTTNPIQSVNAPPRKILKTRGHFPSDEAPSTPTWSALRNTTAHVGNNVGQGNSVAARVEHGGRQSPKQK